MQTSSRSGARTRGLRAVTAVTVGALLAVIAGGAAHADDLYNTIDGVAGEAGAIDATAELMPLVVGGANGETTLRVQQRASIIDGYQGCNMQAGPVTFALRSSNTAIATVEPATVTFTACSTATAVHEQTITVTPQGAGTAQITASVLARPSTATYRVDTATIDVVVEPPPNSPPTVTVLGFTPGATYSKGVDLPTPQCQVDDVEDGTSTFAPTFSRPAPQLLDGLGERLVKCAYTDTRGATAVSSASYFVADASAPVVRYKLSPGATAVRGKSASGWWRDEVVLDWIVLEPQSPGYLTTEGCERQYINTDHRELVVTCTATSAGGSTTVSTERIQYDATVPTVHGQVETPGIDVAGTTWYGEVPHIAWTAEDATSGVAEGSIRPVLTIVDEGRNQGARAVASDVAGNASGTTLRPFNVDLSAPLVHARVTSTPAFDDGVTAWFKDEATVEFTASDPNLRGTAQRGSGLASPATGTHVVTQTTDFTATATDNVGHVGTSNTVPVHVDSVAPVVTATCPSRPILKGLPASAQWTATDEASGLATAASGSARLDTSTVGRHTFTAPVATDRVGHGSAPATCSYRVVYAFVGFFAPIDNFGVYNKVKAGSTVPVKFSLLGDQGMKILQGAPVATKVACPAALRSDTLEETVQGATTSGLKYDKKTSLYNYTWKTPTSFAGTCQKLTVSLVDGTSYTALFTFTK